MGVAHLSVAREAWESWHVGEDPVLPSSVLAQSELTEQTKKPAYSIQFLQPVPDSQPRAWVQLAPCLLALEQVWLAFHSQRPELASAEPAQLKARGKPISSQRCRDATKRILVPYAQQEPRS